MKNTIKFFFLCQILLFSNAGNCNFSGLSFQYSGYDLINGYTTVRVYAEFDQPSDQLFSVFGNNVFPLSISSTGNFHQEVAGGALSTNINPFLYAFFPTLVYDSWMTIGYQDVNSNLLSASGLSFTSFESGGDISESDVAGGSIITPIGSPQNFPVGGKVLIGQFTLNGDLDVLINIQWRDPSGINHDESSLVLHIEAGDPGCNNLMALNFDPSANFDDGSCEFPAPSYQGLSFETVALNGVGGFNTYHIYANFDFAGDQLTAVFGQDYTPLSIISTGSFFQDVAGGATSNEINPGLFGTFPTLEFDSWITIGSSDGPNGVELLGVNTTNFESGGSLLIDGQYGGAWYVLPDAEPSAFPDENGKVLIAQLTSNGDISIELNLQYRAANGTDPQVLSENLFIVYLIPGCTNSSACNFNPAAQVDDGTCSLADLYFQDMDGDGFGNAAQPAAFCTPTNGYTLNDQDCDDLHGQVYPGAVGTHEGLDNNCNGVIDAEESLVTVCPGDFSGDNEVNTSDLLLFLGSIGCVSGCGAFDLTSDGVVNSSDVLIFLGYYGNSCL